MSDSPKATARAMLGGVPLAMRSIRAEMRRHAWDLSVPQFRVLGFVHRHRGTSLSDVAGHIGLTMPSMSKLVDGLVERKLVKRHSHPDDRRRITLELTAGGLALWQSAREHTLILLAERMATLNRDERVIVGRAMRIFQRLFLVNISGACGRHS